MALPMIESGYKPDGALGALYQGFNAANADQGAELELIKQFLANQHAQVQNPIAEQQSQQNLLAGMYKTSPEYQIGMRDTISGQGMSNLAAGQNASFLQPFKQNAERLKLENDAGQERNQAQLQQIDDALNDNEATFQPGVRDSLLKARTSLINRFKETPTFAGKRELRETGTDSAEYIAELRAQQAAEAARLRTSQAAGEKEAKTAEETMQRILAKQRRGEKITNEDVAVYNTAKGIFDAKNDAKRQQGLILDPALTGGALQPKDPQMRAPSLQVAQPTTTTPQGGNDLQAAILAELARRQQQGK